MQLGTFPRQLDTQFRQLTRVLLVGHTQPDADCLGSLSAFASYLDRLGCRGELFTPTPAPAHLQFLPQMERLRQTAPGSFDAVVFLDCGDLRQGQADTARLAAWNAGLVVNIDHHQTNTRFGQWNYVYPNAASTTEILYYYFQQLSFPLTPAIASALLAGILADTGGFHHPNTSPGTLSAAAALVAAGASLPQVYQRTFHDKTVQTLQCWGRVLSRLAVNQRTGIATAVVTRADLAGQPDEQAAASGLANFLNTVGGVRAVLVLVEQADGTVRGSLRSRDPLLDVSKFAILCGGGGHKLAAGFTLKGRLQETAQGWRVVA